MLMNHGGKPYVFGVSAWTGFYCENYSFYTRVDPFAEFIDDAAERAGRIAVKPTIACARVLDNGLSRVYFGYDNGNDVSLDIPYGDANRMPADTMGIRPTHCPTEFREWTECQATLPPDQFECSGDYPFDISEKCMDKQLAYFVCAFGPF